MQSAQNEPIVFQNAIDGADPVLPADVLSFGVTSSIIGYSDFVNAYALCFGIACELGGHLRLEAETVLLKEDALDDVGAEQLVARFHVREVEVGKDVGEPCQELVAPCMPVERDAVRLAATVA